VPAQALTLASMAHLPGAYTLRRPIAGGAFNTRDYAPGGPAPAALLADLEALVRAGTDALKIAPADLPAHACVLLVPDFWDRGWVAAWARLLLVTIGVARVCVLQASARRARGRLCAGADVRARSRSRRRTASGSRLRAW
jgi:hypothetical protein